MTDLDRQILPDTIDVVDALTPGDAQAAARAERLDEDDRLRPDFVSRVLNAVERGDPEAARELVRPLHPADRADLVELTPEEDRPALAAALGDLIDADVIADFIVAAPEMQHALERYVPRDNSMLFGCLD